MRLKVKLAIYTAAVLLSGLTIYTAATGSRYWSIFWASFGYFLLTELYKIDWIENPEDYKKENKTKSSIFKKEFNIALLLIPLFLVAMYGIIFK
jgi:hypothetical protein